MTRTAFVLGCCMGFLSLPGLVGAEFDRGFENGGAGWRPLFQREPNRGSTTLDKSVAHSGGSSMRIQYLGEKDWSFEPGTSLEVKEGDVIQAECWVQAEAGAADLAFALGDSKAQIHSWAAGAVATKPSPGWQLLKSRVLVTGGVTQARPRLLGSGVTLIWVDDFSVERQTNVLSSRLAADLAPFSVSNAFLQLTFYPSNAVFAVTDYRSGRQWNQVAGARDCFLLACKALAHGAQYDLKHIASGLDLVCTFRLEDSAPEVVCEITGEGSFSQAINYPAPFETRSGDDIILPLNEGISYPVEDLSIEPVRLVAYGGHGICMAFFGVTDGQQGMMGIIETPDDAVVSMERADAKLVLSTEWQPQMGAFGEARRLRYVFQDKDGYVGMAKRYRRYAKDQGLLVTLKQKAKLNPKVDLLIGAANIWCWDSNASEIARELQDAGLKQLLWSAKQNPETLTKLNQMGILTSRYDVYQDCMDPANFPKLRGIHTDWTTEAWPLDLVLDSRGIWVKGWQVEAKDGSRIPCGVLCDAQALDYARKRVPPELQTHPYQCRFIDTTTASAFRECYSPNHPLTRGQSREKRMELLGYFSRQLRLVTGSETGHDSAVPFVHYFEGMLSLGPYRVPDAGRRMQLIWTNVPAQVARFQTGYKYRLPLWELVYHDCVVAQWYWGDYNNKLPALWDLRDRFNLLYGTPPMYMFNRKLWQDERERFIQSYRDTSSHVRKVGYEEMTDHRFLTPDRAVQQSEFSDGTVITVNFGAVPWKVGSGTEVGPLGYEVGRKR